MCQAIVKPEGVLIDKEVLRRAWNSNADGAGIAYQREDGAIDIRKGFFKFKSFWKFYLKVQDRACLIHFRWATHGSKKQENCHPFSIGHGAMIHNGILDKFEPLKGDDRSDTRVFLDTFLAPLLKDTGLTLGEFLADSRMVYALEHLIGGSKLAFITPQHGFIIVNESLGEWVEGVWYSAGYPEDFSWMGLSGRGIRAGDWSNVYKDYAEGETIPSKVVCCSLCYAPVPSMEICTIGIEEVCLECWQDFTN